MSAPTLHPLGEVPCPACGGDAKVSAHRSAYCFGCLRSFRSDRLVSEGPAGHWYAVCLTYPELLCKPQSREPEEAPAHPDALSEAELGASDWYSPDALGSVTRRAVLLLLGYEERRC